MSALFASQLLIGLINGSFYAMLSLGLAIIFGLLNVINFAHGALYMLGAFARLDASCSYLGIGLLGGALICAARSSALFGLVDRAHGAGAAAPPRPPLWLLPPSGWRW